MTLKRRTVVLGGLAGAGALAFGLKPGDHGAPHDAYFRALSQTLKSAGIAQPTLVIDRQRLAHNIAQVRDTLTPRRLPVRLVVKSLPSLALLDLLAHALDTQRFMVFNLPMLRTVCENYPQGDLLIGKPLAALAVREWLKDDTNRAALPRIQWLIDAPERLQAYGAIARELNQPLRVSFELDVGLHRGGFPDVAALQAAVAQLKDFPLLKVAGLMGYEAHVGKMPTLLNMQQQAWDHVQRFYTDAIQALRTAGHGPDGLIFNSGGSQTYSLHARGTVANEIAVGTAFVQPCDFDMPTLARHQPASFIATPVLKALDHALIPALEWADGLRRAWDPNTARGYFIHGGNWLAQPVSPAGLALSGLYGRSSNQELWLGSAAQQLHADDYVFFRPRQSEAVFLQFGDLVLVEGNTVAARWPVFAASA